MSTDEDLGALLLCVADVVLCLVERAVVDQGPVGDVALETVADLELADLGGEFLGEFVVDSFLDEEPVGAYAGLAGRAELGYDGACDCEVDVCVVKDDEGGVAAEFPDCNKEDAGSFKIGRAHV